MSAAPDTRWPSFAFYHYDLPLTAPISLKAGTVNTRPGLLVRCFSASASGWGDIAPLDGYSRETFRDVLGAVADLHQQLIREKKIPDAPASIRCGLEFAWAHYQAECSGRSLYTSLGGLPEWTHIQIARLIPGHESLTSLGEAAAAAGRSGFPGIKLKVGRLSLGDDVERVRFLLASLPDSVRLRVDANRSWSLEEARLFFRSLPDRSKLAFVEEPLADPGDYAAWREHPDWPVALDESLVGLSPDQLEALFMPATLVLKPGLLGGLSVTQVWYRWARRHHVPVVISSMYESGVGIRSLMSVAGALAPDLPAGLDTYSVLADDIADPPLVITRGRLALYQALTKSWEINGSKIEQIL